MGEVKEITERESKYIWTLKCVAIFYVVCAHLYPVPENSGVVNHIISHILHYMGGGGVPIFYMISGYIFAGNNKDFKNFWKRKITTILIPWVFCYTLLYFYIVLRKGGFSIINYIQVLIGYQSTAYYLSMLVLFYVIFWKLRTKAVIWGLMGISVYSIICTGWECGINNLNGWFGTYFLNPFNWILFFGIGYLLRIYKKDISCISPKMTVPFLLLSCIYFIIMTVTGEPIFYFSKYALIEHAINIPLLMCIAKKLLMIRKQLIIEIGKYSFTVYLTHQLIAGVVIALTNIYPLAVFTALRPFITIMVVFVAVKAMERFLVNKTPVIAILLGRKR